MKAAAGAGYATATDLADWLVRTLKMPFREAHHVTGRIVALAAERGVALEKLKLARDAERRAAHHRGRLRRARRRALGEEPHVLRRNGAGQRAPAGEGMVEEAERESVTTAEDRVQSEYLTGSSPHGACRRKTSVISASGRPARRRWPGTRQILVRIS